MNNDPTTGSKGVGPMVPTILDKVSGAARVRLVRVIVYEGPADWVKATRDRSVVTADGPFFRLGPDKTLVCEAEEIEVL